MKCVLFTHPSFLSHQSMPRFARMLSEGMTKRGHQVEVWTPKARFYKLFSNPFLKKWMGYIDQYVVFPQEIKNKLKGCKESTLFVFADQALGPWVPSVADRAHVIHCHDFLALRSSLGEIPRNPTGWTGRQYQKLIQRGFSRGSNFISGSKKTQEDLHRFLLKDPLVSEVVYNGLNASFKPGDAREARVLMSKMTNLDLSNGYILHVGGNVWYKNRTGIIEVYDAWRSIKSKVIPILLIGEPPTAALAELRMRSPFKLDIHWLSDVDDRMIKYAYIGADVFFFPSLAEGFGWPVAEAMASGCPVITTNEAPMTEVTGQAGFLIPKRPDDDSKVKAWAANAAIVLNNVVMFSDEARKTVVANGLENSKRFDPEVALNKIEAIYQSIIDNTDS
ncbi:MAG TPA: glycosyltransferase [Chryseolinea sp.]